MPLPSIADLTRPPAKYTNDEEKISAASRTIGWATIGVAVFAIVALWIWATGVKDMSTAGKTPTIGVLMGANLLLGLAAAAAGAVFGFIFGMPRTMTLADRLAFAKAAKEGGLNDGTQAVMGVNTNLERISDWLTTLLVGAALVQIQPIVEWIGKLGTRLFTAGVNTNEAIIPVIAVLFFCLSFLGIYLITRLYLTSALSLAGGVGAAERGADSPEELGGKLNKSLESGKNEDIVVALKAVDDARLTQDERKKPALNFNMARALAKLISSGQASGRADPKAELRAALNNALADPTVAEELKKDGGAKSLATGDAAFDAEISAKINATDKPTTTSVSSLPTLTKRIDDALKSGTAEDVEAAFNAIEGMALPNEAKDDAAWNANIVRLTAKMIELGAASDRNKAVAVLREAASIAGKSPEEAEGLREGFEAGSVTTGDTALDNDIKGSLAPH